MLLLDDVLSGLDGERRAALLRQVAREGQVIITSVEAGPFPPELMASARVWRCPGRSNARRRTPSVTAAGRSGHQTVRYLCRNSPIRAVNRRSPACRTQAVRGREHSRGPVVHPRRPVRPRPTGTLNEAAQSAFFQTAACSPTHDFAEAAEADAFPDHRLQPSGSGCLTGSRSAPSGAGPLHQHPSGWE